MSHPEYKQRARTEEDLSLSVGRVPTLFDLPGMRPWNRDELWAAVLDALIDARTRPTRRAQTLPGCSKRQTSVDDRGNPREFGEVHRRSPQPMPVKAVPAAGAVHR
ncbi:hypothetical protein [Sorangium sp. So ce854]|uniref:hypothetical protein n=1 Tax=Sorangium sp. So ce854 TaxID=3133322 RepID=UPI003F5FC620